MGGITNNWIQDDSEGHFEPAAEGEDVIGYMVFPVLVIPLETERVIRSLEED